MHCTTNWIYPCFNRHLGPSYALYGRLEFICAMYNHLKSTHIMHNSWNLLVLYTSTIGTYLWSTMHLENLLVLCTATQNLLMLCMAIWNLPVLITITWILPAPSTTTSNLPILYTVLGTYMCSARLFKTYSCSARSRIGTYPCLILPLGTSLCSTRYLEPTFSLHGTWDLPMLFKALGTYSCSIRSLGT